MRSNALGAHNRGRQPVKVDRRDVKAVDKAVEKQLAPLARPQAALTLIAGVDQEFVLQPPHFLHRHESPTDRPLDHRNISLTRAPSLCKSGYTTRSSIPT